MSTEAEVVNDDARSLVKHEAQLPQAAELSVEDIVARLKKIQAVQRDAMENGIDYGAIPGTGGKPTLLKAGAEKLCVLFRLDPQFETKKTFEGGHLTVETYCTLYHQVSGQRLGGASAMCSSRESKYAYRKAARKCPDCGSETLIHTKKNPTDWWCNKYKDGCGANFKGDDARIMAQPQGRVANQDVADQFNTVLRIAEKRSLIAAARLVTGASAIFDEEITDADDPPAPKVAAEDEAQPMPPTEDYPQEDPADVLSFKASTDTPVVKINDVQVKEIDELFAKLATFPKGKELKDSAMKRWKLKSLGEMPVGDFDRRKRWLLDTMELHERTSGVRKDA